MSFTYKNLDGKIVSESGENKMIESLGLPSITGGAAGPAVSSAQGSNAWVTMNNPFSVAGQGGKANSTAESSSGFDLTTVIIVALIGAIITKVIN